MRPDDLIDGAEIGMAGAAVMRRGREGLSVCVGDGGSSIVGERSEAPRATSLGRDVVNIEAGLALPGVCGGVIGRILLVSIACVVADVVRFGRKRREGFLM